MIASSLGGVNAVAGAAEGDSPSGSGGAVFAAPSGRRTHERRQLAAACALLPVALAASSLSPRRASRLVPRRPERDTSRRPRAAHALGRFHGRASFQINDGASTQLIFGSDAEGLRPGQEAVIDARVWLPGAKPRRRPAGPYRVQALLNRYETFPRADVTR